MMIFTEDIAESKKVRLWFWKKYFSILIIFFLIACKNDNCSDDGDDAPIGLNIFLKLETKSGDNFVEKEGFNKKNLLFRERGDIIPSNSFFIFEKDNVTVLEYFSRFQSEIDIEYDGNVIASYNLEVLDFINLGCSTQVTNYKVSLKDETSLCSCVIGEIITVPLDI